MKFDRSSCSRTWGWRSENNTPCYVFLLFFYTAENIFKATFPPQLPFQKFSPFASNSLLVCCCLGSTPDLPKWHWHFVPNLSSTWMTENRHPQLSITTTTALLMIEGKKWTHYFWSAHIYTCFVLLKDTGLRQIIQSILSFEPSMREMHTYVHRTHIQYKCCWNQAICCDGLL